MIINSPCKDCKNRSIDCHSHCDKYNKYKKDKEKENKLIRDKKMEARRNADYILDACKRMKNYRKG